MQLDATAQATRTREVGEAEADAKAFSNVDNLTVLNGAQGIGEIMNQVIGQAGPALDLARHALGSNGNGRGSHPAAPGDAKGASGN